MLIKFKVLYLSLICLIGVTCHFTNNGSVASFVDRDFDRFERSLFPYWRNADHSVLHVANEAQQMVNDDSKFAVSLDVSQFRPEELNVHLEGKELTIEGKHQHKNDTSFIERSFVRKWTLPEDVDVEALRTQLNDTGHLSVEAPKVGQPGAQKRSIPIERIPYQL